MPPPRANHDFRHRFERLLRDLNGWDIESGRKALLGPLKDFEIWEDLIPLTGSSREVADRLLGLFDQHGPDPFCALLASLRQDHGGAPAILQEIDALEQHLQQLRARRRREPWSGPPYRGLAFFDRRHAPIFFGRDAEVESLARQLTTTEQGRRFTVVVGASGAGKSSLVRAGFWARLASGAIPQLPAGPRWLVSAMTPLEMGGADPNASLCSALDHALKEHDGYEDKRDLAREASSSSPACSLADLAGRLLPPPAAAGADDVRWLLILDQMEELFSGAIAPSAAAAFLDRLLESTHPRADGAPSRFQVLATLRADFFHHCLAHPPLKRAVSREGGQFLLSAPGRLALESMVSGPLTEVDLPAAWELDPALPPVIAADAERHPGGLALMAFALRELYDRCAPQRRLDLATYRHEDFGGLSGVIARRADETLKPFGEDGPRLVARVFSRLVRVNQDDAPTRRRERRSAWSQDAEASRLVAAFEKARLLVADGKAGEDPVAEVAHEALLREWPALTGWIADRREAFRLAERVRVEAHAWMDGDPARHHRRPWPADVIDEYRGKLAAAELLPPLLEDPKIARLLMPEAESLLVEVQHEGTSSLRRWEIGRRLAEIGDPRPGVGVLNGIPDLLWCPIPAGAVLLEEGDGRFDVAPFHIAAYPVTFSQFRAFVEASDGYQSKRWWNNLKHEKANPVWQSLLANHPVTDVSWYDATAFCRWLSTRLGFEVRLPDEREWQWAAQSAQPEFAYPWGPQWQESVANTSESDINRASAVGMFPLGASHQGVSDLAGNVWEWCRNLHADPTADVDKESEVPRVLRGGSWILNPDLARAAYRGGSHPHYRGSVIGFRVVCSSPIR